MAAPANLWFGKDSQFDSIRKSKLHHFQHYFWMKLENQCSKLKLEFRFHSFNLMGECTSGVANIFYALSMEVHFPLKMESHLKWPKMCRMCRRGYMKLGVHLDKLVWSCMLHYGSSKGIFQYRSIVESSIFRTINDDRRWGVQKWPIHCTVSQYSTLKQIRINHYCMDLIPEVGKFWNIFLELSRPRVNFGWKLRKLTCKILFYRDTLHSVKKKL